jgi:hypothetical protein
MAYLRRAAAALRRVPHPDASDLLAIGCYVLLAYGLSELIHPALLPITLALAGLRIVNWGR